MSTENNTQVVGGGIGFSGALALLFIALKLTGHIAWSWWWVLAPLWGPVALLVAFLLLCLLIAGVCFGIGGLLKWATGGSKRTTDSEVLARSAIYAAIKNRSDRL